ncbi:hypothetical protein BLOT_010752 [Blomia tropicalis]|nr:hypothetical protein BLOT_010750 [Blomia tropicalis]KAI2798773.1 hypothetical protein BLOT_010752 [Blomia tropicalis]
MNGGQQDEPEMSTRLSAVLPAPPLSPPTPAAAAATRNDTRWFIIGGHGGTICGLRSCNVKIRGAELNSLTLGLSRDNGA